MSDEIIQKTIDVVTTVLAEKLAASGAEITASSSMEAMVEWDSLNFINIFLAINEAFDIEPDPDDAIHYGSISGIADFVRNSLGQS
jgi:acyl carrier protein